MWFFAFLAWIWVRVVALSEVAEVERGRAQMETLEHAAQRLGLHRASLYRFAQQGRLRIYKIGRSSRVLVDDVDRLALGDPPPDPESESEPEPEPEPLRRRGPGRPRKPRADPQVTASVDIRYLAEKIARLARELIDEVDQGHL